MKKNKKINEMNGGRSIGCSIDSWMYLSGEIIPYTIDSTVHLVLYI